MGKDPRLKGNDPAHKPAETAGRLLFRLATARNVPVPIAEYLVEQSERGYNHSPSSGILLLAAHTPVSPSSGKFPFP